MEYDFLATIQKIVRLAASRSNVSTHERIDSILRMQTLLLIDIHRGIGITDIAVALAVKKPTASQLVDRLVHDGDLVRTQNLTDRRTVQLYLTESGIQELRRLQASFTARTEKIFSALSDKERQQFDALLGKIVEGLEKSNTNLEATIGHSKSETR